MMMMSVGGEEEETGRRRNKEVERNKGRRVFVTLISL